MLTAKLLSSAGLMLDIVGAWILAMDLIKVFSGPRYEHERERNVFVEGIRTHLDESDLKETPEYQDWRRTLGKVRVRGLVIMSIGFVLQLLSNWVEYVL